MPFFPILRLAVPAVILAACVRSEPAPLHPGPMPPASGAPTAIATNVGQGQYPFPSPSPRARQAVLSKGTQGAISDKVKQCWNIGSPEAPAKSVVTIRVDRINPDGTIPSGAASIADDGGSPAWARAALRAVANPVCQPWPAPQGGLPDESFILVFDPKDVF
ncbi:cell envelope integrity protein TolA [Inquilinus sp. OTU3971]|uniref:cell envelope integrity protein TolA n=1 Tax=Inquilinus sp. OTU3971 TaxID=3043855 RepID=UPI00313DA08D